MVALYKISTNTVIQNYGSGIPPVIYLKDEQMDIHAPTSNWSYGDYELIPVVIVDSPPDQFSVANGTTDVVTNGQLIMTTNYSYPPLAEVQATMCALVDNKAEEVRQRVITPGTGQMGIYLMKYQEAQEIVANTNATPVDYPLNGASVGLPGITTIQEAATLTIQQAKQWITFGSSVEIIRLSGKSRINTANNVQSAISAYNDINWTVVGG
jgi:hypothetical protein